MRKFTSLIILLIMLFAPQLLWSQTVGSISGKVTDAQTGDALPGANVLLKGTSLGASTGLNGNYTIGSVPPGSYTIRVSYVGYEHRDIDIRLEAGATLTEDVKLKAVGVKGKAVVVTAQASGQNAAINEQLSSNRIMNVVSAARISQLPDANAAETVARLPGVYLVRQGGEGTQLAIQGMAPQYNQVLIDGVQMAATNTGNRSANLSMISSSSLRGIQLIKTATPDMDAAFLGGVVNFQLREARQNPSGGPEVDLSTQGSYDNLQNTYNDYKITGTIGDRFFNKRFGALVQVIARRVNLTSDQFGGSYYMTSFNPGVFNPLAISNLNLEYAPSDQHTYDGTVVLDYKLPEGKIDLMNFFSRGDTRSESRSQSYQLSNNQIQYGTGYSFNTLNVITNLLDYKQNTPLFNFDVRLSHSYSENISPDSWSLEFNQGAAGLNKIPSGEPPNVYAQSAEPKADPANMFLETVSTSSSFSRQRNLTGSIDLERNVNFSNLVTSVLKIGGKYRYTYRWYSYRDASGSLYNPTAQAFRDSIIQAMPWMAQSPYNLNPNGSQQFPFSMFEDPSYNYGTFLGGDYAMGPASNFALLSQLMTNVKRIGEETPAYGGGPYAPDARGAVASNYSGTEGENAAYAMATVNFGPQVTLVGGVRYQGLRTTYTAPYIPHASAGNTYPLPFPYQDTTSSQYHGFWLPDVILRYKPFSWFDVRAAYTNTIAYPSFSQITPLLEIFNQSVTWNNAALTPAHSQNYDLGLSFYNNSIGLLTVDGFLKQIDDLIFGTGTRYITDPSLYGLPAYTNGFTVSTAINNPYRVNVWGAELDWQTHFWYLPGPLSGLVLDINYAHMFSSAKYPDTVTEPGVFPTYIPVHIDSFYTDRLIDQPNDVVNLSVGYDFMGFSAIASMIYQANVFNGTNFWPELRSEKASYNRWDIVLRQKLPWYGLQAYLDLNNLNGASDIYVVQGSGFPTSESDYGMTADLGLRWSLR